MNKNAAILKLREEGINPREVEESNSILHKDLTIGGGIKTKISSSTAVNLRH